MSGTIEDGVIELTAGSRHLVQQDTDEAFPKFTTFRFQNHHNLPVDG
jgi:hypothetical protein